MLNVELLKDTLEHIKTHPQQWRQDAWFTYLDENGNAVEEYGAVVVTELNSCNTSYCFAGHAALKAGMSGPPSFPEQCWFDEDTGEDIQGFATRVLGLAYDQASALFDSKNSLEELETMVNILIEKPKVTGQELRRVTPSGYCNICGGPCEM